jgi:hypothetical protein
MPATLSVGAFGVVGTVWAFGVTRIEWTERSVLLRAVRTIRRIRGVGSERSVLLRAVRTIRRIRGVGSERSFWP